MSGTRSIWQFWRETTCSDRWLPSRAKWCNANYINLSWYSKLERGEIDPHKMEIQNFVKLARAYNLRIEDMISQIGL